VEPLPFQEDMPYGKKIIPAETAITSRSLADLVWRLEWCSPEGRHTEELFTQLNVWRDLDCCPPPLVRDLPGKRPGENLSYQFAPGEQAAYYG